MENIYQQAKQLYDKKNYEECYDLLVSIKKINYIICFFSVLFVVSIYIILVISYNRRVGIIIVTIISILLILLITNKDFPKIFCRFCLWCLNNKGDPDLK